MLATSKSRPITGSVDACRSPSEGSKLIFLSCLVLNNARYYRLVGFFEFAFRFSFTVLVSQHNSLVANDTGGSSKLVL